jgi:hypothetical protein
VSVDLDEIGHYHAIHGLAAPGARVARLVYEVALGRIGEVAERRGLPVTLFAIGRDLAGGGAAAIRGMSERGHSVENHSLSHRYDLTRLGRDEMVAEVRGGADAIERVTGRRPVGFRAPGYTVGDALFDVLEDCGVAFDSSVFPCPSYWAAKALVLASMRARGKSSASVLDTPRVMFAPSRPYRPGASWHERGSRAFLELPIQVTPWARLPFIGTSIMLAGIRGARLLARMLAHEPFVNLELHGIDFLDATDGLTDLTPHQPELRRPLTTRLAALEAALDELHQAGFQFIPLHQAATQTAATLDAAG